MNKTNYASQIKIRHTDAIIQVQYC